MEAQQTVIYHSEMIEDAGTLQLSVVLTLLEASQALKGAEKCLRLTSHLLLLHQAAALAARPRVRRTGTGRRGRPEELAADIRADDPQKQISGRWNKLKAVAC